VANHGIARGARWEELDASAFDRTLAINLRAPFLLAQAALPGMRERGFGRILFVSSLAAFTGGVVGPDYGASKAGAIGFMRSLSKELGPRGIRVNVIAPGIIETDQTSELTPEGRDRYSRLAALQRLGSAEEIAGVALSLASDLSSFVSGMTINVDGGI